VTPDTNKRLQLTGMRNIAASICVACLTAALSAPRAAAQAPPTETRQITTLQCRVVSFNYGGRGSVEGFIADAASQTIQVNAPNEMHDALRTLHVGDKIDIAITPQGGPGGPDRGGPGGEDRPDHSVAELVRLRNAQGQVFNSPAPPDSSQRQHVSEQSTIAALNYDHRGVPDGVQLANGDMVHIGRGGNISFSPRQPIAVEGFAEPMADGGRLIHAQSINGQAVQEGPGRGGPGGGPGGSPDADGPDGGPPPPPDDGAGPPPPPDDDAGPPPPADDAGQDNGPPPPDMAGPDDGNSQDMQAPGGGPPPPPDMQAPDDDGGDDQ